MAVDRESEGVLVLKTEYNKAWNYFNAKELGDTILGYWREWYKRADAGLNTVYTNVEWPRPTMDWGGLKYVAGDFLTEVPLTVADDTIFIPDVRKINILNSRVITSRKRTRNLLDLTNLWKKVVFSQLSDRVELELSGTQQDVQMISPSPSPTTSADPVSPVDFTTQYRREHRSNIHQRSPSPGMVMRG
jgi:hypothetical protein